MKARNVFYFSIFILFLSCQTNYYDTPEDLCFAYIQKLKSTSSFNEVDKIEKFGLTKEELLQVNEALKKDNFNIEEFNYKYKLQIVVQLLQVINLFHPKLDSVYCN